MNKQSFSIILSLTFLCVGSATSAASSPSDPVTLTVLNGKEGSDISPIFSNFEKSTGIKINLIQAPLPQLIEKIKSGQSADVIIVNDFVNFASSTKEGIFEAVQSKVLDQSIPMALREPKNRWFGLSYKARTLMYDPARVNPNSLSTLEDLADPKWKGKLCLRNSGKTYNRGLVASLVVHHGLEKTQRILRGWVSNLAQPIFDGDQKLLHAIANGTCAVGITNTYYLGRILTQNPNFPVRPFWSNQNDRGVHVNIAGMALLKNSRNADLAVQLMEFMASDESQRIFADSNFEFPVNPSVSAGTVVGNWPSFKIDTTPVSIFGDLSDFAADLSLSAGYL